MDKNKKISWQDKSFCYGASSISPFSKEDAQKMIEKFNFKNNQSAVAVAYYLNEWLCTNVYLNVGTIKYKPKAVDKKNLFKALCKKTNELSELLKILDNYGYPTHFLCTHEWKPDLDDGYLAKTSEELEKNKKLSYSWERLDSLRTRLKKDLQDLNFFIATGQQHVDFHTPRLKEQRKRGINSLQEDIKTYQNIQIESQKAIKNIDSIWEKYPHPNFQTKEQLFAFYQEHLKNAIEEKKNIEQDLREAEKENVVKKPRAGGNNSAEGVKDLIYGLAQLYEDCTEEKARIISNPHYGTGGEIKGEEPNRYLNKPFFGFVIFCLYILQQKISPDEIGHFPKSADGSYNALGDMIKSVLHKRRNNKKKALRKKQSQPREQ